MILNYLKTAWRTMLRHKWISALNVFGLALGMALFTLISIFVMHETSFDQFNRHADQIFRLETKESAALPPAVKGAILGDIPGVESCMRLDYSYNSMLSIDKKPFIIQNFAFADASILDIFTLPLSAGDARTALKAPFSLILSAETAQRIFGNENPMGRTLRFQDRHEFTITGVLEKKPNTHMPLDVVASFATLEQFNPKHYNEEYHDDWAYAYYLKLKKNQNPSGISSTINRLFDQKKIWQRSQGFKLQPLKDIYFQGGKSLGAKGQYGNLTLVSAFAVIGFFILLLAINNFINLTTARSILRTKEVGIRKTVGGARSSLIFQFLTESLFFSGFAAILALIIVVLLLPLFESLTSIRFEIKTLFSPFWIFSSLVGVMVVTVVSGLYPAFILSAFKPSSILKSSAPRDRNSFSLKSLLLVFQFIISISLIICTLTVHSQLTYLKTLDPGFSGQQVIHIALNPVLMGKKEPLKQRLLNIAGIQQVSFSNHVPGQPWWTWGINAREALSMKVNSIDPDFLPLMDIKLLQGRNFSWDLTSDGWNELEGAPQKYIMNETAAKGLGLQKPVDRIGGESRYRNDSLIGIVKDFHYASPHTLIKPMIFYWAPKVQRTVSIRLDGSDPATAIKQIESIFIDLSPAFPFEYAFLNESYGKQFMAEEQLNRIFGIFSLVAVIIAVLGLLGMTSFLVLRKRKEIGIRKVLGASIERLFIALSGTFLKWVLLANLIAWPLSYFLTKQWLQGFPYRIDLGFGVFFMSGFIAVTVALATISYQTIQAALANPTSSLKYE